ncbi:MAG: metallophosphoesterase [Pyrinomonadaceae bacterium]|nr:metallophosphoesterase [Sphingobacteriaceae bacterium]
MTNRRNFLRLLSIGTLGLSSFRNFEIFEISKLNYNILLGKPTDKDIALSLLLKEDAEAFIEYGSDKTNLIFKTSPQSLQKFQPGEFVLTGLPTNQRCFYRVCYQRKKQDQITKETILSFYTKRTKSSDFVFTITADSHLGTLKHCDPALYQLTLNNVAKDKPDLHFSMGDDFRASRINAPDYTQIEQLYLDQREHLGTLCNQVPFFFILGNHEMEAKAFDDGTENCLAAWSARARRKFIPNPIPDSFYTGNQSSLKGEKAQNYFAFEWGDVLFLTLDVFRYSNISAEDEQRREESKLVNEHLSKEEKLQLKELSKNQGDRKPRKDEWAFTLGSEQYNWLKETLAKSKASHKFVFGHHVLGSTRGGVEWASLFEWGGKNRGGSNEFAVKRPGWELPIHGLFVKHKVTAFFQGHDHLFARQELDGIAYITCPMSGDPGYNTYNSDGFLSGDKLSNTGHLKISVSAKDVQMRYIKAVLSKDEAVQGANGKVVYAYSFTEKKVLKEEF